MLTLLLHCTRLIDIFRIAHEKKKKTSLQNDAVYHLGDKCIQPVMGIYTEYLCCCQTTPGHRVGQWVSELLRAGPVLLLGGRTAESTGSTVAY